MRRRLRKKLRLGEFTQYGFTVQYNVGPSVTARTADDLLDRFIVEAIEANDLHCGGGGGPAEWDFFVCANGRRSATSDDRERVHDWLARQPEVTARCVGELRDAWHGEDDQSGTEDAGADEVRARSVARPSQLISVFCGRKDVTPERCDETRKS